MYDSHAKFYSAHGKRQVLVVDDEMINREILGNILADSYEVAYAADGLEALEKIREYGTLLALKDIGCDIVQGYYFSKPVPADDFAAFLVARMERNDVPPGGQGHVQEQKKN